MAKHKKSRHHDDDHDEGHSEGWLVSYSDMMTLLFGLFVMLYSIAMENQGKVDEQLSAVSSSLTKVEAKPPPAATPEPPKTEELQAQIQKKDDQLAEMKKNLEQIMAEKTAADLQITDFKVKNTELKEKVDELKKITEAPKVEEKKPEPKIDLVADIQKKNKELQQELELVKQTKKKDETEIDKLQKDNRDLEKKVAELKPVPKREPAAIDKNADKVKELTQELQKQKDQETELQKQVQQKDKQVADINKELKDIQKELKDMQEEEKKTPKFLMFVLKWFTDRHDLDLVVYDSKGKKFDFKKREYPNYPGRFALDSRAGPGAEIWQTNEFIPGEYRMVVQFYQEYNNPEPARFAIEVSSPKSNFATSTNTIKFSEKTKEFRFKVSEKGTVTLL